MSSRGTSRFLESSREPIISSSVESNYRVKKPSEKPSDSTVSDDKSDMLVVELSLKGNERELSIRSSDGGGPQQIVDNITPQTATPPVPEEDCDQPDVPRRQGEVRCMIEPISATQVNPTAEETDLFSTFFGLFFGAGNSPAFYVILFLILICWFAVIKKKGAKQGCCCCCLACLSVKRRVDKQHKKTKDKKAKEKNLKRESVWTEDGDINSDVGKGNYKSKTKTPKQTPKLSNIPRPSDIERPSQLLLQIDTLREKRSKSKSPSSKGKAKDTSDNSDAPKKLDSPKTLLQTFGTGLVKVGKNGIKAVEKGVEKGKEKYAKYEHEEKRREKRRNDDDKKIESDERKSDKSSDVDTPVNRKSPAMGRKKEKPKKEQTNKSEKSEGSDSEQESITRKKDVRKKDVNKKKKEERRQDEVNKKKDVQNDGSDSDSRKETRETGSSRRKRLSSTDRRDSISRNLGRDSSSCNLRRNSNFRSTVRRNSNSHSYNIVRRNSKRRRSPERNSGYHCKPSRRDSRNSDRRASHSRSRDRDSNYRRGSYSNRGHRDSRDYRNCSPSHYTRTHSQERYENRRGQNRNETGMGMPEGDPDQNQGWLKAMANSVTNWSMQQPEETYVYDAHSPCKAAPTVFVSPPVFVNKAYQPSAGEKGSVTVGKVGGVGGKMRNVGKGFMRQDGMMHTLSNGLMHTTSSDGNIMNTTSSKGGMTSTPSRTGKSICAGMKATQSHPSIPSYLPTSSVTTNHTSQGMSTSSTNPIFGKGGKTGISKNGKGKGKIGKPITNVANGNPQGAVQTMTGKSSKGTQKGGGSTPKVVNQTPKGGKPVLFRMESGLGQNVVAMGKGVAQKF